MNENDVNKKIAEYPFLQYIKEDKSHYKHAKDCGYNDPDDLFLIGESGGFLLNINYGDKFVNTDLFTPMAIQYKEYKNRYTLFKEDSIPHIQLRKREEHRRRYGFSAPCLQKADGSIVNIRITGDHYNFLNYILIEKLNRKSVKVTKSGNSKGEKIYDFPAFIDAQFWTFHIIEFVRNNGFHLIIDKTRRGGFSYIMASTSANIVNLKSKKVCIHVADDKKYLTQTGGLTNFAMNNLLFYENKTPFVRGIISTDKENFKLGFKLPNGVESPDSWSSALISVSAGSNPNCAIGKDAIEVKVEEVSTMTNFDEFMAVTEPAMRTGSYTTGTLICWGTATAGNMQVFERNFYSPRAFHFMPFENVWDKDSRHEVCGYFKAYVWGLEGEIDGQKALDDDGNSNIEVAFKIALRERADKKKTAKTFADYINYLGQYANQPAESFSCTTDNIFSSPELLAWEETLKNDNSYTFYVDGKIQEANGKIEFVPNARIIAEGGIYKKDYFDWIKGVPRRNDEDPHGCIRKWFNPLITNYLDKTTNKYIKGTPPGMYCITYDPVGIDKDNKELTDKNSHNSIKVWEKPTQWNAYKQRLVAAYYGRPNTLKEADYICLMLAKYYNCVGNVAVEVNRGETVSNFSAWGATKYLFKDPIELWDNSIKAKTANSYGIYIAEALKYDGLRLLKEMLYSVVGKDEFGNPIKFYKTIYDHESILELIKWNNIGNFDRVSEMLLRGIIWKNDEHKAMKELEHRRKIEAENATDENNIFNRDWF